MTTSGGSSFDDSAPPSLGESSPVDPSLVAVLSIVSLASSNVSTSGSLVRGVVSGVSSFFLAAVVLSSVLR